MKENLTCDETSKRFGIGINSVVRWSKKLEPQRTRNKPATKINMEELKRDIKSYPDAYQYERAQRLNVSTNCVHFALKRLHVTYKKKASVIQKPVPKSALPFARGFKHIKKRVAPLSFWMNRDFLMICPGRTGMLLKDRGFMASMIGGLRVEPI
jgi:transposase